MDPEVDAVAAAAAATTRRLVPKDNARGVLSTTPECPGKLSLDSHYEPACIPFCKMTSFPARFSRFSAARAVSNVRNMIMKII